MAYASIKTAVVAVVHDLNLAAAHADRIVLRLFKWDVNSQPLEAIDVLEPFHTAELAS